MPSLFIPNRTHSAKPYRHAQAATPATQAATPAGRKAGSDAPSTAGARRSHSGLTAGATALAAAIIPFRPADEPSESAFHDDYAQKEIKDSAKTKNNQGEQYTGDIKSRLPKPRPKAGDCRPRL